MAHTHFPMEWLNNGSKILCKARSLNSFKTDWNVEDVSHSELHVHSFVSRHAHVKDLKITCMNGQMNKNCKINPLTLGSVCSKINL